MRRNYLLIMPRFVDKVGEWYHFPLGLPYVSASLKAEKFNIFTVNLNNIDEAVDVVLRNEIVKNNIDVILTGGLTFQYESIYKILRITKNINPSIITIVGGGIITGSPKASMKALEIADIGIVGEGEITTCKLFEAIEKKMPLENIEGIIFKKDNDFQITKSRKEIQNLDTIAIPDYKGFGFDYIMNKVASMQGINESNAITMISSRSCPYRCTFCFHTTGQKFRQRSLDNFFEELDFLVNEYKVKYIYVADELFCHDIERVKKFCKRIQKYNIKWWAQFRVTDVTKELVALLKESNCTNMGFGLESANNKVLKSMNKHITIEEIERALEIVYQGGIAIQGCFIFGDVIETMETARETLDWWKNHMEYGINLNFITTYPGTQLYKYALENNLIKDEVAFIKKGCPTINVSKMSNSDVEKLSELIFKSMKLVSASPANIEKAIFDHEEATISFCGECVSCGQENSWNQVRLFTRNVLNCSKCGHKHKIPILDEVTCLINNRMEALIAENGNIGIWGINDYFFELSTSLKAISNDHIFLIDSSNMKQGTKISGNVIVGPEIIKAKNVNTIVIPVVSYYTSISDQIREQYPQVERILSILELIS